MRASGIKVSPSNLKHHGIGARKLEHKNMVLEALPTAIRHSVKSLSEIKLETETLHHSYSGLKHREMLDPKNKYVRTNQTVFIDHLTHAVGGKPSERANRRFDLSTRPDGDWLLSTIDVLAHTGVVEERIRPITNNEGVITNYIVVGGELGQEDISIALKHYGVKGMKWGVRRKRQADGGAAGPTKREARKQKKADQKAARKQERKDNWKKPVDPDAQLAMRTRGKRHGTDALSDDDLKKLVNRMNMEVQYATLVENKKGAKARASGQQYAKDILKDAGRQVASEAVKYAFDQAVKKGEEQRSSGSTYTPSRRLDRNELPRGRLAIGR